MDATERFIDCVQRPVGTIAVEELALLIAAHAHCALDIDSTLHQFDALAERVRPGDLDSLCHELFEVHGLRGNTDRYHDPENSYLDSVMRSRRGIPISLAVITIAVGRRADIALDGVGMPGHFLVRAGDDHFLDPFDGGRSLDTVGCADLFRTLHGPAAFDPSMLAVSDPIVIAARMLNNLLAIFRSGRDHRSHLWVARLRTLLPGSGAAQRADFAIALAESGQFDAAASAFDELASDCSGPSSEGFAAARDQLRHRLN